MGKPVLFLMLGNPGAGKTTAGKHIAELTGAIQLSSDQIRIQMFSKPTFSQHEHDRLYKAIDKQTEDLLRQGISVIYDANLNRYQHRKDKYDSCKRTGAQAVLIWRQTPRDIAKKRATHLEREHLIPPNETAEKMFERITSVIEKPKPSEKPVILKGEDITKEAIKKALNL